MKGKHIVAIIILSLSTIVLLVGTCGVFVLYKAMPHDGPKHEFALPGESRLTDQQVLDFSKQVLIAEGKYSSVVRPSTLDASGKKLNISHGSEPNDAYIGWYEPISGRSMLVHLRRTRDKVTGAIQGG